MPTGQAVFDTRQSFRHARGPAAVRSPRIDVRVNFAHAILDPDRPFEQAIINEYLPGQGIAPHIDRDCFGPVVATVSLGSAVNMDFHCDATGDDYVERLEPRSLLLMHGDARSGWRHGIAKRQTDNWSGQKIQRHRRVSITFRTITEPVRAVGRSTGSSGSRRTAPR
ncbi:alpha-ketoglutarate-dependent dioxygenase AlkB [Candidatus Poriferisodalis sp.]|uniref:alpha-ketoglutarate-dependent dioxygenase AlkB n=1 Tax=Candidatus Poriferisodalis sp. TaxID=3101277 RepID=UPI003C701360